MTEYQFFTLQVDFLHLYSRHINIFKREPSIKAKLVLNFVLNLSVDEFLNSQELIKQMVLCVEEFKKYKDGDKP